MNYIIPIIIVFFNCILGALGAFLLKKGAKKHFFNWNNIIGISLYVIGSIIFVITLKFAPVSVLYPITGSTYIWSFILAKKYLEEKIDKYKIIGLIAIILGIVLISIS